jgi:hypothetical protein
VPQNRLFIIVVECISIDGKAILLLIIVLSVHIIKKWFYKKMTRHKLVIVFKSGYINEGICLV